MKNDTTEMTTWGILSIFSIYSDDGDYIDDNIFFILITTYIVNTNLTFTGRSNHRCVRPKKTNTNKKASWR